MQGRFDGGGSIGNIVVILSKTGILVTMCP